VPDNPLSLQDMELDALRAEVVRLNKITQALIDRAERSTNTQGSDFSLFQTTVMLEEQVRQRTADLEAALRDNEAITRALRLSEDRFRGLATQSMVGIAIIESGRFTFINPALHEMLGYTPQELSQMNPSDIVVEEDRQTAEDVLRRRMSGELDQVHHTFRARHKNGSVVNIEIHGSTMRTDGATALVNLTIDITERIRAEREVLALQERLKEQSIRDALTGLYNRRYLEETLARELNSAERLHHPLSVVIADVDHFKSVNDRYGHPTGDDVLRRVSKALKRHCRGSDIACRYGGEEFLLVLPGMGEDTAWQRAEQLRQNIADIRMTYEAHHLQVTASFGVASFPIHGATGSELILNADKALYQAKSNGRNQVQRFTAT